MTLTRGIVFGATGDFYCRLARRAARNVRQVMPDIAIHLFADRPVADDVFDAVHPLDTVNPRPKMEALEKAPFDLTLYLDCDVVMLHPVDDIFDCLAGCDIVGAHHQFGSAPVAMQRVRGDIPAAFRQINSGVLGIRRSPATTDLMRRWREDFVALGQTSDQPLLRELLYDSPLRLIVLPAEYNMMHQPYIRVTNGLMMAPRLLHVPGLHELPEHGATPDQPFNAAHLVSPAVRDRLNALAQSDRTLGGRADARTLVGETLQKAPRLYRLYRRLRRLVT